MRARPEWYARRRQEVIEKVKASGMAGQYSALFRLEDHVVSLGKRMLHFIGQYEDKGHRNRG